MKSNLLKNTILVVGQGCMQQEVTRALGADYHIIAPQKHINLLTLAHQYTQAPCIIIIEYNLKILPEISDLKAHFRTYSIPIIAITSTLSPQFQEQIVQAEIDDFIQTPINHTELRTRILMSSTRALRNQNANPLTKLPGNELIIRTIAQRLDQPCSIMYIDLDYFKAYNDAYGFTQGDRLLLALAQILIDNTQKLGNPTDFVGHLGGDDFVIISTPDKAELIAQEICTQFDVQAPEFYNQDDRKQKKIITLNRQGNMQEFPIITISCALVSNALRPLNSIAHVAHIITQLKPYAKSKPAGVYKSNYVKDRRAK